MSQSPIKDFSAPVVQKYKHRWGALTRLLHADHSFSGGERHCAFLNLKGKGFADISAVTGFDFAEDGRALVLDDWDFDGDLDVWVTARTAPRVRLLENNSQNEGEALFVRLQGNGSTTNLEAIGARCEVWLKGDDRPITRSLKGGDSFLSQTGSWLHFGLGKKAEVSRVIVHWPAGEREAFTGLQSGGRYLLDQGKSEAKRWTPPIEQFVAKAPPFVLPSESDQARIVVPTPLLLPLLETKEGKAIDGSDLQGPVLVNMWSNTCSSCLSELKEWTGHAAQFKEAGLRILALNVDGISEPGTAAPQKFLREINFPHLSRTTNEGTLQRLDLFQRSFLDRWLPLPVPCSFLLDTDGKVAVIYKGPVTTETLLADLSLLGASPETLRKEATPFSGVWAGPSLFSGPKRYIAQLLDHKRVADTEGYYQRYLEVERKVSNPAIGPMVEALKTLALIAGGRKNFNKAVTYLEEAVALVPQAPDLQMLLRQAEAKAGKVPAKSIESLLAKVKEEPKNGSAHLALADAYQSSGNSAKAVESYKNTLRADPKLFVAAGRLAWILATHPDSEIRNPKMALGLSNRLMSMNGGNDPKFLDLHGIALAANGEYAMAIEKTNEALAVMKEESPYKRAIESRLLLYKEGKPYLEKVKAK